MASLVPTAASAVGSTRISTPAAAMRGPPMPISRTPGSRARSARHMVAPWRSPDASPAESMMRRSSPAVIYAHHSDPGAVRYSYRLFAVHEEHLVAVDGQRRRAALHHGRKRRRSDGRDVEAEVVPGRHRLDDDRAETGKLGAPADRLVGALGRLDGQRHAARAHDGLPYPVLRQAPRAREPPAYLLPLGRRGLPRRPPSRAPHPP